MGEEGVIAGAAAAGRDGEVGLGWGGAEDTRVQVSTACSANVCWSGVPCVDGGEDEATRSRMHEKVALGCALLETRGCSASAGSRLW
eukprot:1137465-Pelagomonas_calceolata.AAC.9